MTVRLNPYLSFRDDAREAMAFYHSIFGGELTVSTFGEFNATEDPSEQDNVMHSQLETPDGLVLMGADTPSHIGVAAPGGCLGLAQRRR
jgi:PhnB protein